MSRKAVRKKRPAKKSSRKASKKTRKKTAKKATRKKTGTRKATARKSTRKKSAARKTGRRKTAAKKSARKSAVKKSTRKKSAAKNRARKSTARAKAAAKRPAYIAPGYHTITPHIIVGNGVAALDFYRRAFGAEERFRLMSQDGQKLMHAEITIGGSIIMLGEEMPNTPYSSPQTLGGTAVSVHVYVADVDAAYARAVAAGATGSSPPQDMFWGDRFGQVTDPFGHRWSIATHQRDPSAEEIAAGAAAMEQQS